MNTISEIHELIERAGVSSVDFIGHRDRPTIQKDGIIYEIFSIVAEEDGGVTLLTVAVNPWWGPKDLSLDLSWRSVTLSKIKRIAAAEIARRGIDYY